jgi:hypothetical protein
LMWKLRAKVTTLVEQNEHLWRWERNVADERIHRTAFFFALDRNQTMLPRYILPD